MLRPRPTTIAFALWTLGALVLADVALAADPMPAGTKRPEGIQQTLDSLAGQAPVGVRVESIDPAAVARALPVAAQPASASPPRLELKLPDRSVLSQRLEGFLREHGWRLVWSCAHDYPIEYGFEIQGDTLSDVLTAVTRKWSLRITMHDPNRVVRIEPALSQEPSMDSIGVKP